MDDRLGTKESSGQITAYPKTTLSGGTYSRPPSIMVDVTPTAFVVLDVFPRRDFDQAAALAEVKTLAAAPLVSETAEPQAARASTELQAAPENVETPVEPED